MELDTITTLPISTVKPTSIPAGMIEVSWERRSTEKTPVREDERYRGILTPEDILGFDRGSLPSKFVSLVTNAIHDLACARLTATLKADPSIRSVPQAHYSVDALLQYASEERARNTLDNAKLRAWLEASSTLASIEKPNVRATWLNLIPKLAAPGYHNVLSADQAASVIQRITDADSLTDEGELILRRCQAIIERSTKQRAEL